MTNAQLSAVFQEMSTLLELAGENPFRIRAYQRAAQVIGGLPQQASGLTAAELLEIPGIGKGIAAHIAELLQTGGLAELGALRKRFPPGLLELIAIPGLGPKRARMLFEQRRIDSRTALRKAAQEGRLQSLPGFGAKLEENLLRGLAFAEAASKRMNYWDGRMLMEELLGSLEGFPGIERIEPAGSLRRGRETVGDLDILCASSKPASVIERFTGLPQVERVIAAGDTKASVWLKAGLQCDLRAVPAASFGAALQYFTGSKDHNVALRERALKLGLTVNEYGVFRLSDKARKRPLAGRTEEEVYARLGLAFIPPELRENRGELEAAAEGTLPRLVELKDIRGDFHNHSSHTDGADALEDMARAARSMGWEWAALGDHSKSLRVANGLSVDRLRKTTAELAKVAAKVPGIRLLRSMEVDILKDGTLDYPDPVLGEIDVVVASVHSGFTQPEDQMTDRIRRAAANPHVDLIGHLSGRLIGRREAYRVDVEAVLRAGAESGAGFEINGQPQRQDLADAQARRARELGARLAVTTDAHATAQFRYMELAVLIARRAWLAPKDLLNCLSYEELREWLARPRKA